MLSAGVRGPLLLVGFLLCPGSRWKLQHCCSLAFLEMGQRNLLAVRHFQDIVMDIRLVLVPLPEDRGREPSMPLASSADQRSLMDLSKASSVPGRIQTAVASPIGSSTDLNPTVPRPKLWLTRVRTH